MYSGLRMYRNLVGPDELMRYLKMRTLTQLAFAPACSLGMATPGPAAPHDALFWRWAAQSAVREGRWKPLRGGDRFVEMNSNPIWHSPRQHNVLRLMNKKLMKGKLMKGIMMKRKLWNRLALTACAAFLLASLAPLQAAEDEFRSLFNGRDLTGWDGNPELWSVEDGCITGTTTGPEQLAYNQFLIWRGGVVKNFELRAKIKQSGNNSGIQYRSRELPENGKWSVGGYQCDVHPSAPNNAMVYEEKGRGIVVQNGQSMVIDPQGASVDRGGARAGGGGRCPVA